jgi:hypothetical protein
MGREKSEWERDTQARGKSEEVGRGERVYNEDSKQPQV